MTTRTPFLLAATAALFAACGDALVDGTYPGEALFTISGWVNLTTAPENISKDPDGGSLRVAVFWAPAKDATQYNLPAAVEQTVGADGTFPARFKLSLYEPPSNAVLRAEADGSGEFAVALIVAYLDANGNHRWDQGSENLIGGAEQRVLMYTPRGVTGALFGQLPPGFHRVIPTAGCEVIASGVRYEADLDPDLDLAVSGNFPSDIVFDFDCDGKIDEWTGVCPTLESIRFNCRDVAEPSDPKMCSLCESTLWAVNSDGTQCDEWANKYFDLLPSQEVVNDWIQCRTKAVAELDWGCPVCACESIYSQCKLAGLDPSFESCAKHKAACESGFN